MTSRKALILFATVYGLLAAGLAWVSVRQFLAGAPGKGVLAAAGTAYFVVRIAMIAARVRSLSKGDE